MRTLSDNSLAAIAAFLASGNPVTQCPTAKPTPRGRIKLKPNTKRETMRDQALRILSQACD